jgi:hypothetical protein
MVRVLCPTLALALTLGAARALGAQAAPAVRVELGESSTDSATGATVIAFNILPEVCSRGHVPTVSLNIYNVLVQVVATPVLEGDVPVPLAGVKLKCGEYRARWDGRQPDGRAASTGVYYYQLNVDGERFTRKLIVPRHPGEA